MHSETVFVLLAGPVIQASLLLVSFSFNFCCPLLINSPSFDLNFSHSISFFSCSSFHFSISCFHFFNSSISCFILLSTSSLSLFSSSLSLFSSSLSFFACSMSCFHSPTSFACCSTNFFNSSFSCFILLSTSSLSLFVPWPASICPAPVSIFQFLLMSFSILLLCLKDALIQL